MDLDCGPLIRQTQLQRVQKFLADARQDGIPIAGQGQIDAAAPKGGFYQAPVLFKDVPPQHALAQQEIFGPVLSAMPFDDEADAVRIANGTDFGLVSSVWTRDGGRQLRLARKIRAFNPFPGATGKFGDVVVKLWQAQALDTSTAAAPGQVLAASAQDGVLIACGQGVLRVTELQKPGGKRLAVAEFLKGFALEGGSFH